MRGKYERSPGFRLLKTDSFAIMFYGYYQGLQETNDRISIFKAAQIFCAKYEQCEIEPKEMVSGYSRLVHIIRDMQKTR